MAIAARTPKPSTAIVPQSMTNADLMALLGQAGMTATAGTGGFHRMSLTAGTLITDPGTPDEEAWPPTKRGPTMVVRVVKPPVFYNSFYLDFKEENGAVSPRLINRDDLNGKFVKKYDDPAEQALDEWSNAEVYDDLCKATGKRGSFKGDIQVQIVPESGEMTGNEPIYTLSLSTTSALDWRGSSKNPAGGVVQEKNFIVQLAELALEQAVAAGADATGQAQAVLNAMTALRLGGVVAEVYLIQTSNEDKSRVWTVVAFKPIHIEVGDEVAALPAGALADDPSVAGDAIPF